MNSKIQSKLLKSALCTGLLLCAGVATVQASSSLVSFSVDMTGALNFVLGTDTVAVRGTFNGYGTYNLTNNSGGVNPYLFSGTVNDTSDANGGQVQYKFWNSDGSAANGGWENTVNGQNRAALLPSNSGGALVLPTAFFDDEGTPVAGYTMSFQVDMTQQRNVGAFTPGTSTVEVQGNFEGWSTGDTLTNDPTIMRTNGNLITSNVYVGTFALNAASPGQVDNFKYVIQPGAHYEQPASVNQDGTGNRFVAFVNNITNPIVFFSDAPPAPVVTNVATFSVDMSALVGGIFQPSDPVDVRGGFNNWSGGVNVCTNDPNAANTNIYSSVVPITDGVGATEQYKFTYTGANGLQWENPAPPTIGGNRFFLQPKLPATNLPVVFFSDVLPNEVVPVDTEVTFSVNMTGASEYPSHTAFDPATGQVFVNGVFGFLGWDTISLAAYQLTNNPVGSSNYSLTLLVPKGSPLSLTYKYGIYDGSNPSALDNEAAVGLNHFRYIRQTTNYAMPTDTFGNQFGEPIAFGSLSAGKPVAGKVPISWLGEPGVHLQSTTSLSPSSWVDLFETDGTNWVNGFISNNGFVSVTNYPTGGAKTFFRLIRPGH